MNIYQNLIDGKESIVVVGLGYVGLPLAVAYAKKGIKVIGFDVNQKKIEKYRNGEDPTNEIGSEQLKKVRIEYTTDPSKIKEGRFIIVAVPTPVGADNTPDLFLVESASKVVGENLAKGSIVVYESTVYPGVTEEVCVPILEKYSGMKCGKDFKVGYSPERINPGDKEHTLETITKIVSGMDEETVDEIEKVYEIIITAGVYKAPSIQVAEASKVIENTQRDINIAFVNELAIIFEKMGISVKDVLKAAGTKWNFNKYNPGLVGGHCIGVDPYYLIHRAQQFGYQPRILTVAREINNSMSTFVTEAILKKLKGKNINPSQANVLVLGLSFKENVPDLRNSKVADIVYRLKNEGVAVDVVDPHVDAEEAEHEYNIKLIDIDGDKKYDAVVVAVAHNQYREADLEFFTKFFKDEKGILIDVKGIVDKDNVKDLFDYWTM